MSRLLKIHFFVHFVHPQGTYFRFHNLARALVELGHDVEIFGCDQDRKTIVRTESRDGIPYHIYPTMGLSRFFNTVANPFDTVGRGLLSPQRCDIAHLFQPFPNAALMWKKVSCSDSLLRLG